MRTNQRGSVLLLAIIIVMILGVIGVGVLRFTYRETAAATASAREQGLVACAEAARQVLASRFSAFGTQPLSLEVLNTALDTSGTGARTYAVGGHYDTNGTAGAVVTQISALPESSFGPNDAATDISNVIRLTGPRKPFKVVVRCQQGGDGTPGSGQQLEIEFGVRFGI